MTRLKAVATNPVERPMVGDVLPFYALEQIESGTGRLSVDAEIEPREDDTAVLHRPGDVRFGKLRPYLAKSLLMADHGSGSGELLVLRPRAGLDPRYLHYLTLSKPFVEWATATSYGVKMPRTNWESLAAFDCDIPSRETQVRLAELLDAATAHIDALITEQLATRELLEERVWSLFIDRLLALDPPTVPLRRVLLRLSDGPFGSAFTSGDYSDAGAAVVRLGNIGFAEYRGDGQARVRMDLYERFRRHEVNAGDVLIAGLGDARNHAGRACVAPDLGPAIVKGKCFVASVDPSMALPMFIALYLSSALGRDAIGEAARGSTRSMINLEIAKSSMVLLPDPDAQQQLMSDVMAARAHTANFANEIERQLGLLREHRQALITAAVTGGLAAVWEVA